MMRESDQRLSEYILGREDHGYMSRSSYYHEYEDAAVKQFTRGDRVQVGGPLGGYGTVECTFSTDSNVKVRMDQTHKFIVFHESDVEVIEKKEREQ